MNDRETAKGIDIRIVDMPKDGNLPINCFNCRTNLAVFVVKDGRLDRVMFEIRSCVNPACLAAAFSYVLRCGYGISAEGSMLSEGTLSDLIKEE
ncbi:MAG: hypothetical protein K9M11_02320 [Candidatus Pacebacteria bacterium]|nr:hypothetical protein [Candidatus Paceibacterota bacterium]